MRPAWVRPGSGLQGILALSLLLAVGVPSRAADDEKSECDPYEECKGYYSGEELCGWVARLSTARLTGTDAHTKLIDHLESSITEISDEHGVTIHVESLHQSFTRWDSGKSSVSDSGGKPLEGTVQPVPYSGITDAFGVTGELYDAGVERFSRLHFDREEHGGKIVVLRLKPLWLEIPLFVRSKSSVPWWRKLWPGEYRRPVSLELTVPSLGEALDEGVRGLIVISDEALGQYVPFFRRFHDVPAVYVDTTLGKKLVEMAQSGKSVTIKHEGKLVPETPTRHLIATLLATSERAGCTTSKGSVLIGTHTDGPNFFQENGVVALWSLLDHYAQQECRPRDLQFVFASAHFSRDAGSMDDVLMKKPELKKQTRAALVIEQFGALELPEDPTAKPRKSERMLLLTTRHDKSLNQAARDELMRPAKSDEELRPIYEIKPKHFTVGEGQFLEAAGIPTIGFLTNPAYLLSMEENHRQWFSQGLFCKELDDLRDLVDRMMKLDPR